jgi:hypothetical protein
MWVTSETPLNLFILYEISSLADIGEWLGVYMPDESSIAVKSPDIVSASNFPFDTYDPGNKTQIIAPTSDTLTVTDWQARNPLIVEPGTRNVLMANMTLEASANSIRLGAMKVDLKGSFTTSTDIETVNIFHDVNDDGQLDIGIDKLLSKRQFWNGTPPSAYLSFTNFGLVVQAGSPEKLLIVYDISHAAYIGNLVGVRLVNETYFGVGSIGNDVVSPINFPLETGPDSEIVSSTSDVLSVIDWQDKNPLKAQRGNTSVIMVSMTLMVSAYSISISSIDIALKGSITSAADISSARIYHDVNDNGILDIPTDSLLGFNAFYGSPSPMTTIFFGTPGFTVSSGTPESLLITYDISPLARVGDFVGLRITDETQINLQPWSIDSVSPANFPIETSPDTEIIYPIGNLIGQSVDVNGDYIGTASVVLCNSTGYIHASTLTNDTGWFAFNDINQTGDELTIQVSKEYYKPGVVDGIFVVRDKTIEVGPFSLQANATIHGKIITEEGTDLENALVELLDEDNNVVMTVTTNSSGEYIFNGVGYGNYSIRVNATGYEEYTTADIYIIDRDNLNLTIPNITLIAISDLDGGDIGNWWWIAAIIVIAVILVMIYFLARKREKRPGEHEEPTPPVNEDEV